MAFFSVYVYSIFKQQNPKSVNHKALLWLVGIYILDGMNYIYIYIYIYKYPEVLWLTLFGFLLCNI